MSDLRAFVIVCAIKGFPPSFRRFFFGTPFEPPRAPIKHIGFIMNNFSILHNNVLVI